MDDVDINDDDYLSQISGTDSEDDDVNDLNPEVPRICDLEVSHTKDDSEWDDAMEEASHWQLPKSLRQLFVTLILLCGVTYPDKLFEKHQKHLGDDILFRYRKKNNNENLQLTEEQIRNETLCEIEQIMAEKGLSLTNIPDFPKFDMSSRISTENKLIAEELDYDCNELRKEYEILKTE
ncbi:hypothetical protein IFM89_011132 [Coptis chinensis]|uniref:Uncharacterized protein n=1 Tax=Coptis chinensis TaxID=261450 RepID=A0A835HM81_9MAGN|nr:hypothetical protein IFM89_011132 [Coptis chinensis]